MPYSNLLKKIIADKNYNYADIIRECQKRGEKIDKTYLSKIVNGRAMPPKENISKLFAEICGVDERLLIIEGYLDKAPEIIRDVFVEMKKKSMRISMQVFQNKFDEKTLTELENIIEKEPLADFVLSIMNSEKYDISDSIELNDKNYKMEMTEPMGITMDSDAMFPVIPQNAKVILKIEEEYKNGDILVVKIGDKVVIRESFIYSNTVVLLPINTKYEMLTYDIKDIMILGKAKNVIIDL